MIADGDNKLAQALERQKQADLVAARQAEKVRELTLASMIERDPECIELARQRRELREQLHRLRLRISRKQFSVGVMTAKIEKARELLVDYERQEQDLVGKLQGLEAQQEAAEDRLAPTD